MMNLYPKEHKKHEGGHWSYDIINADSYLGSVEIRHCTYCSYVDVKCLHVKNAWTDNETKLICNLCGMDGT